MTAERKKLVEALESAQRSCEVADVICHQVVIADAAERLVRAQFALAEHDDPGSGVRKLHEWVGKVVTGQDEELLEGFTGRDDRSSTRHAIGGRMRQMCEELFASAGVEWTPPASVGEGPLL